MEKMVNFRNMLLLGFITFIHAIGFSQASEVITGHIIADSIKNREVNIVNLGTKLGTLSDAKGNFEISARVGDTLFFSSLQYESYRMVINAEIFQQKKTTVYLYPLVNELEEVTLNDSELTGDLTKDVSTFDTYYFDPTTHGFSSPKPQPTTAQRRLYTATSGGGIIPLAPIINYFSGRLDMLKRQRTYEIEKDWLSKGKKAVVPGFFTNELQLPKAYVDDFLYFCLKDPQYKTLVMNDHFRLIAFFQHKKEAYQKWKGWKKK